MTKAETALIRKALEHEAAGLPFAVDEDSNAALLKAEGKGLITMEDGIVKVTDAGREAFEETLKRD